MTFVPAAAAPAAAPAGHCRQGSRGGFGEYLDVLAGERAPQGEPGEPGEPGGRGAATREGAANGTPTAGGGAEPPGENGRPGRKGQKGGQGADCGLGAWLPPVDFLPRSPAAWGLPGVSPSEAEGRPPSSEAGSLDARDTGPEPECLPAGVPVSIAATPGPPAAGVEAGETSPAPAGGGALANAGGVFADLEPLAGREATSGLGAAAVGRGGTQDALAGIADAGGAAADEGVAGPRVRVEGARPRDAGPAERQVPDVGEGRIAPVEAAPIEGLPAEASPSRPRQGVSPAAAAWFAPRPAPAPREPLAARNGGGGGAAGGDPVLANGNQGRFVPREDGLRQPAGSAAGADPGRTPPGAGRQEVAAPRQQGESRHVPPDTRRGAEAALHRFAGFEARWAWAVPAVDDSISPPGDPSPRPRPEWGIDSGHSAGGRVAAAGDVPALAEAAWATAVRPGERAAAEPVPQVSESRTTLAETVAGADLLPQVVKAVHMQWRDGVGEARLRLQPENLGEVRIQLSVEDGRVTAEIGVDGDAVGDWVRGHEQELRAALADQGLVLDRLVVDADGGRQRQPDEGRWRREGPRPRRRGQETARFEVRA